MQQINPIKSDNINMAGNSLKGTEPELIIEDLSKEFRVGSKPVPALNSIHLAIKRGEFISIVGGSGCGKSTLLRIIAGLENSFTGTIQLDGQPVHGPGTDRVLVFQEHRLFPWLTIKENIAFGLSGGKAEVERIVREHITLVGLDGFSNAYPGQLSGGMAQRAAIARAIVNRPKILLMDEPFGALDAFTKIQMQEEVLKIWRAEQATIILVTHDIDEAVFLSDRVLIMSNRPGTIHRNYSIDLARPRDRNSYEFVEYRRKIYNEFFAEAEKTFAYEI
ncbi:MAG: ABC transporter ATP-binding protein [Ignavibacteriaceae bacterium]